MERLKAKPTLVLERTIFSSACALVLAACASCAEQKSKSPNIDETQVAQAAAEDKANQERFAACENGFAVAEKFLLARPELQQRMEAHYQKSVSDAELKYMESIRNYDTCNLTVSGLQYCIKVKNDYAEAQIRFYKNQESFLEIYQTASSTIEKIEHAESIRNASGAKKNLSESCSEATELLLVSDKIASSVANRFPFLSDVVAKSREVLAVAKARIDTTSASPTTN